MKLNENENLMTVSELARFLKKSRWTIYKKIQTGKMKSYKAKNSNKIFVTVKDWQDSINFELIER